MILREIVDNVIQDRDVLPSFDEEYDLVVVGLGTAGAISLIAAGREGLNVLGVEQLHGMGGTATLGAISGYYFGSLGGLYLEMDDKERMIREENVFHKSSRRETALLVRDREARACGAKIKYECIVTGVYMEENKVCGLRLFQNGKEILVKTRLIIDATGEATVCHIAGCLSDFGREFDGQAQPTTSSSIMINEAGRVTSTNKDAGYVNQHDPRDVSRVIINSNNFPMYLKDDYSEDSNKFIAVAPLLGVREGRLIKGKKTLTMKNMVGMTNDETKPLFYTYCNLDNHGKDIAFEDEDLCDWMVASGLWGVLMSVPVPMDVLMPENIENIMVAGRCMSVDHNMAAGIRVQKDMTKSGEAAAYICSEAIKKDISLSEVDYDNIVEKLKATKCLDETNNHGFMERIVGQYLGEPLPKLTEIEEILTWLAGEKPGWAIWACRNLAGNCELVAALKENLSSDNEYLSRHCALALGIMGEKAALPKLRAMASEPDNYVPKSSLKYIYTRGVSAVYLLGKLGDIEAVDRLFSIVERRGVTELGNFEFGEFYNEATDVYSQYVLFASRALLDIAKKHPEKKHFIIEKLHNLLENPEYHVMITLRDNSASLHDLKPKLLEYIAYVGK